MKKTFKSLLAVMLVVAMVLSTLQVIGATESDGTATDEATGFVKYVKSRVGESFPSNSCQAFVWQVVNIHFKKDIAACCATTAWNQWKQSTTKNNIPLGATIYWGNARVIDSYCGQDAGHSAIYVGDNTVVHAWDGKIVSTTIDWVTNKGYTYRGWGWHANYKISQPTNETDEPDIETISNGTYYIKAALSNDQCVLDIAGQSTEDKAKVQLWTYNGRDTQKFKITKSGDYYSIVNIGTGKAIDIANTSGGKEVSIYQNTVNESNSQKWQIIAAGDGYYYIKNYTGYCIDVVSADCHDGTNIWLWPSNQTTAQKFKFVAVSESSASVPGSMTSSSSKSTYSTTEDVIITWTTALGATEYGLTVKNDDTNETIFDGRVTGTSKNLGKLSPGTYRFNMCGYNSVGAGPISTLKRFDVEDDTAVEDDPTIDEDALIIYAEDTTAYNTDGTVDVAIKFENNPGVTNLGVEVLFDSSVLKYTGTSYGNIFAASEFTINETKTDEGSLFVSVFNGLTDKTENGTLLTFTFEFAEDTELGDYEISVAKDDKFGGVYNVTDDAIPYEVKAGTVTIEEKTYIPGDANGDGTVDRKDLNRLAQYFARWDVEIDADAADANGDGNVDRKDLNRLAQYFARWDVELG